MSEEANPVNHVQELALNINKLPERYVHKDSNYRAIDSSCPVVQVPVIDYTFLTSKGGEEEEIDKLRSAHFMGLLSETSFLEKVFQVSKQFFSLPIEEKKYSRAVNDVEGYGNDNVVSEHQTLDWLDRQYLLVDPEDQTKFQYWPEYPKNFSENMGDLGKCSKGHGKVIELGGKIKILDLEKKSTTALSTSLSNSQKD